MIYIRLLKTHKYQNMQRCLQKQFFIELLKQKLKFIIQQWKMFIFMKLGQLIVLLISLGLHCLLTIYILMPSTHQWLMMAMALWNVPMASFLFLFQQQVKSLPQVMLSCDKLILIQNLSRLLVQPLLPRLLTAMGQCLL